MRDETDVLLWKMKMLGEIWSEAHFETCQQSGIIIVTCELKWASVECPKSSFFVNYSWVLCKNSQCIGFKLWYLYHYIILIDYCFFPYIIINFHSFLLFQFREYWSVIQFQICQVLVIIIIISYVSFVNDTKYNT